MIHSNMTRAIETANIITESLPKVPVLPADSILREGAPIAPEPKVGSWKPEYYYEQVGRQGTRNSGPDEYKPTLLRTGPG